MNPPLRTLLLGPHYSRSERNLGLLFAVGILVATFAAYALGFFRETSGVLVLPGDATLVGFLAAVMIGSQRGGLVFAWLAPFTSNVGFYADWAFLDLSGRSLDSQLAFLFDPVRLSWIAVTAIVVGTIGFGVGYLGRRGLEWLKGGQPNNSS